jgi:hypothetical protein
MFTKNLKEEIKSLKESIFNSCVKEFAQFIKKEKNFCSEQDM